MASSTWTQNGRPQIPGASIPFFVDDFCYQVFRGVNSDRASFAQLFVSLLLQCSLLDLLHLRRMVEALIGWLFPFVSASIVLVVELRFICDVSVHFLLNQELVLFSPCKIFLDIAAELVL